jgi:hypothetical protein
VRDLARDLLGQQVGARAGAEPSRLPSQHVVEVVFFNNFKKTIIRLEIMAEGSELLAEREEPVSVSVSSSKRCATDAETGEFKCHTLERVWKRYADGSSVTEETRRPASAAPAAGWTGVDGLDRLFGGFLGAQLGLAATPQLGERTRGPEQRPDRPPGGGQWA